MLIASSLSGIWAGVYAAGSTREFYALDFDEFQQMSNVMTAVTRGRRARISPFGRNLGSEDSD